MLEALGLDTGAVIFALLALSLALTADRPPRAAPHDGPHARSAAMAAAATDTPTNLDKESIR